MIYFLLRLFYGFVLGIVVVERMGWLVFLGGYWELMLLGVGVRGVFWWGCSVGVEFIECFHLECFELVLVTFLPLRLLWNIVYPMLPCPIIILLHTCLNRRLFYRTLPLVPLLQIHILLRITQLFPYSLYQLHVLLWKQWLLLANARDVLFLDFLGMHYLLDDFEQFVQVEVETYFALDHWLVFGLVSKKLFCHDMLCAEILECRLFDRWHTFVFLHHLCCGQLALSVSSRRRGFLKWWLFQNCLMRLVVVLLLQRASSVNVSWLRILVFEWKSYRFLSCPRPLIVDWA